MPEFKPINSIKAHCTYDDLKKGDLVWGVTIEDKTEKLHIFPCRIVDRHDIRNAKGLWQIGFWIKYPDIQGLCIRWWAGWLSPSSLFASKEDALIAAEAWMREKFKEDADFIERYTVNDEHWDDDSPHNTESVDNGDENSNTASQ